MEIIEIRSTKHRFPSIDFKTDNGKRWRYESGISTSCECGSFKLSKVSKDVFKRGKFIRTISREIKDKHIASWTKLNDKDPLWICDKCVIERGIISKEEFAVIKTLIGFLLPWNID